MKSQSRFITAATLVVVTSVLLIVLSRNRSEEDTVSSSGSAGPNVDSPVSDDRDKSTTRQQVVTDSNETTNRLPSPTQKVAGDGFPPLKPGENPFQKSYEEGVATYLAENVRPIFFYGLVVDEKDQPIADAHVSISQVAQNGPIIKKSDAMGRFELSGYSGRYLGVEVSKPGYYMKKNRPRSSRQSFDYSPLGGNFQPDISSPIVFELRKKGLGVELVTSQYGVIPYFDFSTPKDGSPVWVNFFERKTGASGQMEIKKVTPKQERTDRAAKEWRLTLSIPSGGFVELANDEFPFYPPEAGYQPVLDFHYQPEQPGWTNGFSRQYYIAFGNPRRYGRIKLETGVTSGIRLEYAINPDGSPYLEPKTNLH